MRAGENLRMVRPRVCLTYVCCPRDLCFSFNTSFVLLATESPYEIIAIYDGRASSCLVLYDYGNAKSKALTRYQYMNAHESWDEITVSIITFALALTPLPKYHSAYNKTNLL